MIETTVRAYLNLQLTDAIVRMELPAVPDEFSDFPDRFVLIEKVGGRISNFVRTESIAIQSHSNTLYGAAQLDEEVRTAMDQMAERVEGISACRMQSNYNFTDSRTKRYRYQCVYDITY